MHRRRRLLHHRRLPPSPSGQIGSGETCVDHVCQTRGTDDCPAGTVDVYGVCCSEADVCGEVATGGGAGEAVCCSAGVCCDEQCVDGGACCADAGCASGERCHEHVCVAVGAPAPDKEPPPPVAQPPAADGEITQLPSTGSGANALAGDDGGLNPLLGAGLAAGAAFLAGKTLRRQPAEATPADEAGDHAGSV